MINLEELKSCSDERWSKAQEVELRSWLGSPKEHDDWNSWWLHYFKNYESIKHLVFNSFIEVGCGPYAKNTEFFLKIFPGIRDIFLMDPLLDNFIKNDYYINKVASRFNAKTFTSPLETFKVDKQFDVVLCINVLDHVRNTDECMESMFNLLSDEGIIIIGQDLTNEEDLKNSPESLEDVGHPIKLDHLYFREKLKNFKHLYQYILPREYGRNQKAHYGTLFYIGQKKA